MTDWTITEMLDEIGPLIRNRWLIHAVLTKYWANKFAIIWETNDLHRLANEQSLAITENQAVTILQQAAEFYSSEKGLRRSDLAQMIKQAGIGRALTKREVAKFDARDEIVMNIPRSRSRN